ncbi:MAG: hypothetical protein KGZ34_04655 [Nitrosarchaeum sp.]|nr:hypothetical protein [Nitrosarchaeum sp.]
MIERNILRSSKRIGKYEAPIIEKLEPFFQNQGFQVVPHARLNISWGNIISDIDLLLIKENKVGIVEVKSSHDNLKRAKKQISNIKDYVDFAYIATDFKPRKLPTSLAGWIFVDEEVTIMKYPQSIHNEPSHYSVDSLPKKCLERYLEQKNLSVKGMSKYEITDTIMSIPVKNLKDEIKSMATCGQECDVSCPIWEFEKLLIPTLISR